MTLSICLQFYFCYVYIVNFTLSSLQLCLSLYGTDELFSGASSMDPIEQKIHLFSGVLLHDPIVCYLGFESLRKYIYGGYLM